MNYFAELDRINIALSELKAHQDYLLNSLDEIASLNKKLLSDADGMFDSEYDKLNESATKLVLREEAMDLNHKTFILNDKREEIIKKILGASKFSVKEIIDLMDDFGSYHKVEERGLTKLIVPQDLDFDRFGRKMLTQEESDRLVSEYMNTRTNAYNVSAYVTKKHSDKSSKKINLLVSDMIPAKKSAYNVSAYVKTQEGIKPNKEILTFVAGLEVTDIEGVQIYKREGNDIVLNGKVVNLFPYDVLAFLDYAVMKRIDNPNLSLKVLLKEYKQNNKVLAFSKDDPALEDIYRHTR